MLRSNDGEKSRDSGKDKIRELIFFSALIPSHQLILEHDDDDDNLIVFPPKADDNSYSLNYSIPVQIKTRPECGITFK